MNNKQLKIGDRVIVISKYEIDNYWVGNITHIYNKTQADVQIGNQVLNVDLNDLELYNEKINWIEYYKEKYPHPEFWNGD